MSEQFSEQVRIVFELAQREAKNLNHNFVGTEHLLLALLQENTGLSGEALRMLGLDAARVRAEVEKLITRGPQPIETDLLPFTPRAKRVMEYANQEAMIFNQKPVGPEHLLLGLFREPGGVAVKVLENLGFKLADVRREVLKIRLAQMKIVESVVRPIRAGIVRKRKMREELLAHLESIYLEERARLNDSDLAFKAAAERFGNPADLAGEFDKALSSSDRRTYWFERWLGWRPLESAARYMGRQALFMLALMAIIMCIAAVQLLLLQADAAAWRHLLPLAVFAVMMPLDHFLLGVLFFKIRDAIHGPPHARKSFSRALLLDLLGAAVVLCSGFIFIASTGDLAKATQLIPLFGGIGLLNALWHHLMALRQGPAQIADTYWAYFTLEKV